MQSSVQYALWKWWAPYHTVSSPVLFYFKTKNNINTREILYLFNRNVNNCLTLNSATIRAVVYQPIERMKLTKSSAGPFQAVFERIFYDQSDFCIQRGLELSTLLKGDQKIYSDLNLKKNMVINFLTMASPIAALSVHPNLVERSL